MQSLPKSLEDQIGLDGALARFEIVNILGLKMDPNTTTGVVAVYIVGALLVAAACFGWHFALLALAKYRSKRFSIKDYFQNYWVKMYPLLWSTSSESLATPLNLYILSTRAPWVSPNPPKDGLGDSP